MTDQAKSKDGRKTKEQLIDELQWLRQKVADTDRLWKELMRIYKEAPVGFCYFDTNLRFLHINDWLAEINGMPVEKHLGRTISEVLPDVAAGVESQLRHVIATGKPIAGGTVDAETPAHPGLTRTFEHNYFPIKSGDDTVVGVSCVVQEITERKRAEEEARRHEAELAHIQRRSTMGEMAAALAHELNQPLTAVATFSEACLRKMRSGEWKSGEFESTLEEIRDQAERGGAIMRRIRQFVQRSEPATSPAHINDIVHEAAALVAAELRTKEVELALELEDGLPLVSVDAIEIEQVVLNLVRNSIDAMMETEERKRRLVIGTSMAGDAIEVTVRDTGPGLSAESAGKAFEPFFTTKREGVGMGLSISRTIVKAHGGRLWASQDSDRGATFCFTLPNPQGGT